MQEELKNLLETALADIGKAESQDALNEVRVRLLGKKGELTQFLRGMGKLSPEERPVVGQMVNDVRDRLENALAEKAEQLKQAEKERRLAMEVIDVTLPGQKQRLGTRHPITLVLDEIKNIFLGMGYSIAEGPEIETDYYNFEALNIPKDHPAREMQDSFFITDEILLRSHTSPVQARSMEKAKGEIPLRIIVPGRVYRRDDDATHSPMFTQVEGLVIDKGITLADLRGTLLTFARQMFGEDTQIRLRPSFFPFTEPSVEVDISCVICGGRGCRVCKESGWLEILGAGMVHPRVLSMSGYNPEEVTGFAFGMGPERIAMLKYGINDMRLMFDNDLRFLRQF